MWLQSHSGHPGSFRNPSIFLRLLKTSGSYFILRGVPSSSYSLQNCTRTRATVSSTSLYVLHWWLSVILKLIKLFITLYAPFKAAVGARSFRRYDFSIFKASVEGRLRFPGLLVKPKQILECFNKNRLVIKRGLRVMPRSRPIKSLKKT